MSMPRNPPHEKLNFINFNLPAPLANEVLLRIETYWICQTHLAILNAELAKLLSPIIPKPQRIVEILALASNVNTYHINQAIRALGETCGCCYLAQKLSELAADSENKLNTSEYCVLKANADFESADNYSPAAQLFYAYLISYRSFKKLSPEIQKIAIYNFEAAAQIISQVANDLSKEIYVFTQDGDSNTQALALQLGAVWAGGLSDTAPNLIDGAIIYSPTENLLALALQSIRNGGEVVGAGIDIVELPSVPDQH